MAAILIIEDDQRIRESLAKRLSERGHDVETVITAMDGVQRAVSGDFDVVVLDLKGKSPATDYFVIATGTSDRQIRNVADDIREFAKKNGIIEIGVFGSVARVKLLKSTVYGVSSSDNCCFDGVYISTGGK